MSAIPWADIVGPEWRALRRSFVAPRTRRPAKPLTPEPLKPERGRRDKLR